MRLHHSKGRMTLCRGNTHTQRQRGRTPEADDIIAETAFQFGIMVPTINLSNLYSMYTALIINMCLLCTTTQSGLRDLCRLGMRPVNTRQKTTSKIV